MKNDVAKMYWQWLVTSKPYKQPPPLTSEEKQKLYCLEGFHIASKKIPLRVGYEVCVACGKPVALFNKKERDVARYV